MPRLTTNSLSLWNRNRRLASTTTASETSTFWIGCKLPSLRGCFSRSSWLGEIGIVISSRGSERLGERYIGGFLYHSGSNHITGASDVINPGSLSVHKLGDCIRIRCGSAAPATPSVYCIGFWVICRTSSIDMDGRSLLLGTDTLAARFFSSGVAVFIYRSIRSPCH